MTNYTPMIEQYRQIKQQHLNEILFFRLGDFYEMFFDDAEVAAKVLEITLTARDGGSGNRVPMCGIPYHAADNYISKLIRKGFKIAICEQIEDPKQAKGIVKREVIKVITPGTILSDSFLQDHTNQYLTLCYEEDNCLTIATADISTGECTWASFQGLQRMNSACDFIYHLKPVEIIISGKIEQLTNLTDFINAKLEQCLVETYMIDDYEQVENLVKQHFSREQIPTLASAITAVGALLFYLHQTQKNDLSHINQLRHYNSDEYLLLDAGALRNLEIIQNMHDGSKKGTLLAVLDHSKTAMGTRLLRNWLQYPLRNPIVIQRRHEAVAELIAKSTTRSSLRNNLKEIYDLERLLTKIEVGSVNGRDMIALKNSLSVLQQIKEIMQETNSHILSQIAISLLVHNDIVQAIDQAIIDEPPFSIRDGGLIKPNYDIELDELRIIAKDSNAWMHAFENEQKTKTGIKNLKVGYNKIFGYYIEITKSNISSVPPEYIRKQTLVNAERYITPALKEFETKILGANEKMSLIEYQLFMKLREYIKDKVADIQETARQIAQLDVLSSLSEAAVLYNYVQPSLTTNKTIHIKDGRHPVIERLRQSELFVPNDTLLSHNDNELLIITGPNMAGKSTYMRQVALIVIMAQSGSFIPAREAKISPVDKVFTRVGASDDLATGQSTFMVEMNEVANILQNATSNSLIILDEIGRGTSTYDGISIAKAVVEYIITKIKAKTLFATHYHELTNLAEYYPAIKNLTVAVKEKGNQVAFLRRIIPGSADKSYGIHVAQLAGLPPMLLTRAREVLQELEQQSDHSSAEVAAQATTTNKDQALCLFTSNISNELLSIDVMSMTPIEAINLLYKLQQQAKREEGISS